MNCNIRKELRYFFPKNLYPIVLHRLENLSAPEVHLNPFTATIYFVSNSTQNNQHMYVRLRFYCPSTVLGLECKGRGFLECKYIYNDRLVEKNRYGVDDVEEAFEWLIKGSFDKHGVTLDNLQGCFYPVVGVLTHRSHWIISATRLTLDHDIKIFAFENHQSISAHLINIFPEDKLEIKFKVDPNFVESLETLIMHDVSHHEEGSDYLEGRIRECHKQWKDKALYR